jgi:hypothetical protein
MEVQQLQLADFRSMFEGNKQNYGEHIYKFNESGKESGTNRTVTNKLLTGEQYKAHLNGKVGLGIIPINAEGQCHFGVIDVDVYEDLSVYIEAIERCSFPLVPFRSKSGGLHLYMFLQSPTAAKIVIELLNKMVLLLGLDMLVKQKLNKMIEVFPKQHTVKEGSVGNWINLPYFNAESTKQCAIKGGESLSLSDALVYMKDRRRTLAEVRAFIDDVPVKDGPPCIQTIQILNIMEKDSGRNTFLFSCGVYLKKKDESFWEQKLFEVNAAMRAPLPKNELEGTVIASLRKKDFAYKCFEQPCVNFCRRPVCKTRDFGVGKEGGYFSELEYGKLSQIKTNEPYYEWEVRVQGGEAYTVLRFKNEDEIIKQDAFLKLCFRELHLLPIKMKQSEWFKLINQALAEVDIKKVEPEDDTSPYALFISLFSDFLLNRAMAQTKDQILAKRVYLDASTSRYYFRSADLSDYMFIGKNFRYYSPGELHGLLRDVHAQTLRIKTESGKQIRVYEITSEDVNKLGQIDTTPFKAKFAEEEKF